jgi:SAM-dependent methyltransferase
VSTVDYSAYFTLEGDLSGRAAKAVVPLLMRLIKPSSVVDVGCGVGSWLDEFQKQGVSKILGIDFLVQESSLRIPKENFLRHDLQEPISVRERFDVVLCMEVGEHLPKKSAATLVQSLIGLGSVIVFSAAIPYQVGGGDHINEQWPEWWADLFRARGFKVVDFIRRRIWLDWDVPYWYSQNLLVFVSNEAFSQYPDLLPLLDQTVPSKLSIVHPRAWLNWTLIIVRRRSFLKMFRKWLIMLWRSATYTVYTFSNAEGNER